MEDIKAIKQANIKGGRGGIVPPVEKQFGQPNGNPRHSGAWKKKDTARYKLERMLELSEKDLMIVASDKTASLFERRIARSLLKETNWKITESMINQVYGLPKQSVETIDLTPPKPLSPRKQKDDKR